MPLDDVIRCISAATPQQQAAIAKCATAWRKRSADSLEQQLHLARTVLVTTTQWRDVLVDSDIEGVCSNLDDSVAEIAAVMSLPARDIGRRLFALLDQVMEIYSQAHVALAEAGRFIHLRKLVTRRRPLSTYSWRSAKSSALLLIAQRKD
ncbi:hypothetical protein [Amycolatopsis pretoriensis]|uniref:hypothetical protein n=1 Tax=Amycolatopsis pretoriensis TaxID=218821 RepID=UPI00115FDB82|nr:hypothetical protein [Amycolatopsis pretoriensis]